MRKASQRKLLWRIVGAASAVVAAQLVRMALDSGYRTVRGSKPPQKPWRKGTALSTALLWTGVTSMAIGMAEVLAEYAASQAWRRRTGRLPPD